MAGIHKSGWASGLALAAAAWTGAAMAAPTAEQQARITQYEALYADLRDPSLALLIAETWAQANEREKAVEALRRAAGHRAQVLPVKASSLHRFAGDPEFDRLMTEIRAAIPQVSRARAARELAVPGLLPEGVAWDPATRRLFIGDAVGRRVLRVLDDGRVEDFARDLKLRPLGMTVEPRTGHLWVATTNAFWDTPVKEAALLVFDPAGKLLRTVTSPAAKSFNDVAFAPNGDLYATDSDGGAVFRLRAGADAMDTVVGPGALNYPNGVAVSADGRAVFVAQGIGIRRIDLATGGNVRLALPKDLALMGVDGLYRHGADLIAVQNGAADRVLRLTLSPDGQAITAFEVLENAHPALDIPTTAAIADDRIYLLANAQVQKLGADGTVDPTLKPIVILELPAPAS